MVGVVRGTMSVGIGIGGDGMGMEVGLEDDTALAARAEQKPI